MARAAWAAWERHAEPPCGDSAKRLMGPRVGPGSRRSGLGAGPVGPDRQQAQRAGLAWVPGEWEPVD